MNLNDNPTREQLRELIGRCDDSAGHHVLWVTLSGEVKLSPVPFDRPPDELQRIYPDMRLRVDTFLAGNEYVGAEAAADDDWLTELFQRLINEWSKVKEGTEAAVVGNF